VAEPDSNVVRQLMSRADAWFVCRVGFVEVARAVALTAGRAALRRFESEWLAFGVLEVDQALAEHAAELAIKRQLRSLDALHLAAALVVSSPDLVVATWDRRLHGAAKAEGLKVAPEHLQA
jgi:predicted nucleic acid-binding protein